MSNIYLPNVLARADHESALRVTISDNHDGEHIRISPNSTVMFKGEEISIEDLFKYIEDLENNLTDALFASKP